MMIRLIVEDCHRPVNLLHENKSYHLVGEGHPAQGYFLGSRFIHSFAEPVRTSDDEDQPPRDTLHFLLHVVIYIFADKTRSSMKIALIAIGKTDARYFMEAIEVQEND